MKPKRNVNVTLVEPDWFADKKFPCPVCGASLSLRLARTQKPYCHCDPCGIQLFFRGKNGIQRLQNLLSSNAVTSAPSNATVLYNRLQQLKREKTRLEDRQGLIFRDRDLDHVIAAVDTEIEVVRAALVELKEKAPRKK